MALTTTQLQVIKALVTGSTIKDAAEAAGIHRSTVHEWTRAQRGCLTELGEWPGKLALGRLADRESSDVGNRRAAVRRENL